MSAEEADEIKVVLLGNCGVGKTNLILIYEGKKFEPNSITNFSTSLSIKKIEINNKAYEISLWDTAGQEKFKTITKSLLNGANVVIYVYSIIDQESFKDLDYWIQTVKEKISGNYISGIVGNKKDLYMEENIVNEEIAKEYAKSKNYKFKLCSAKTEPNLFIEFINELICDYVDNFTDINKRGRRTSIKIIKDSSNNNKSKKSQRNRCDCI
jgi:small GTP-binding protein